MQHHSLLLVVVYYGFAEWPRQCRAAHAFLEAEAESSSNDDAGHLTSRASSILVPITGVNAGRWPRPNDIPYRIDTRYSAGDRSVIVDAINNINNAMTGCVRFRDYVNNTDFGRNAHLYIGPMTTPRANPDNGQAFATCFSFAGLRQDVRASRGAQKLGLVNGTTGCLGLTDRIKSVREVMKYLVNVLGIRDEWKRADRDHYLTITQASVLPANVALVGGAEFYIRRDDQTGAIANSQVQLDVLATPAPSLRDSPFDYNSITLGHGDKYATAGSFIYAPFIGVKAAVPGNVPPLPTLPITISSGTGSANEIANTPFRIITPAAATNVPALAALSRDDCKGLAALYSDALFGTGTGCSARVCQDPYNQAVAVGAANNPFAAVAADAALFV